MNARDAKRLIDDACSGLSGEVAVDYHMGVERFDGGDGHLHARPNGTATIIVRINGGAHDSGVPLLAQEIVH